MPSQNHHNNTNNLLGPHHPLPRGPSSSSSSAPTVLAAVPLMTRCAGYMPAATLEAWLDADRSTLRQMATQIALEHFDGLAHRFAPHCPVARLAIPTFFTIPGLTQQQQQLTRRDAPSAATAAAVDEATLPQAALDFIVRLCVEGHVQPNVPLDALVTRGFQPSDRNVTLWSEGFGPMTRWVRWLASVSSPPFAVVPLALEHFKPNHLDTDDIDADSAMMIRDSPLLHFLVDCETFMLVRHDCSVERALEAVKRCIGSIEVGEPEATPTATVLDLDGTTQRFVSFVTNAASPLAPQHAAMMWALDRPIVPAAFRPDVVLVFATDDKRAHSFMTRLHRPCILVKSINGARIVMTTQLNDWRSVPLVIITKTRFRAATFKIGIAGDSGQHLHITDDVPAVHLGTLSQLSNVQFLRHVNDLTLDAWHDDSVLTPPPCLRRLFVTRDGASDRFLLDAGRCDGLHTIGTLHVPLRASSNWPPNLTALRDFSAHVVESPDTLDLTACRHLLSLERVQYTAHKNDRLKRLLLPPSLTRIVSSFHHVVALSTFIAPPQLVVLTTSFNSCVALTDVDLTPASYLSYVDDCFSHCDAMSSLMWPRGIRRLTWPRLTTALIRCVSIDLTCYEHLAVVDFDGAFPSLRSVKLPATLTALGVTAFTRCPALEWVDMGLCTRLDVIAGFAGCAALQHVEWAPNATLIAACAFRGCTALQSVDVSALQQLVEIGKEAFDGCTALTQLLLPAPPHSSSLVISGFADCRSLRDVRVVARTDGAGAGAASCGTIVVAEYAFDGCAQLAGGIDVPHGGSIEVDGFSGCGTTYFPWPGRNVNIFKSNPFGVGAFDGSAFLTCVDLGNVTAVTTLGGFCNCTALTRLVLPPRLRELYPSAFSRCSALTEVPLETCAELHTVRGFSYCTALTEVTLPPSVVHLCPEAFTHCATLRLFDASACTLLVKPRPDSPATTALLPRSHPHSAASAANSSAAEGVDGGAEAPHATAVPTLQLLRQCPRSRPVWPLHWDT